MDTQPEEAAAARRVRLVSLAFAVVAVAVVAATVGDYGVAWDEAVQARYGEMALDYFASRGGDRSYAEFLNLRYYGALFEMAAAAAARLVPGAALEARHAAVAATAVAAVLATIRFARFLGPRLAPAFACVALATMPLFYGHAFQNSKDMPFAAAFAWCMVAIVSFAARPRPRWRDAAVCGVAVGIALAVRVGGVFVLGFLAVAAGYGWAVGAGADGADGAAATRGRPRRSAGSLARVAAQCALAALLAWAIMVASWPFAHADPLGNPLEALSIASAFPYRFPVLFEGAHWASDALPARYVAKLLLLQTPLAVLALAAVGLLAAVARQAAAPRSRAALALLVLELWVLLPPAAFALARPPAYDGVRHFLFVLPGLALLAALGAAQVAQALPGPAARRVAAAGLALLLVLPVADLFRLHPYQMTYFNPLAGGVAGAWRSYETDYWATSYREAMEWIGTRVPADRRAVVLVAANDYSRACAERFRPQNVEVRTMWEGGIDGSLPGALPAGVDYYLATTRVGLSSNFGAAPIVHAVGRDGAVFAVVRGSVAAPAASAGRVASR